jgi:hypothetical protein
MSARIGVVSLPKRPEVKLETYLREGFAVLAVLVVVLGTDSFGVGRSVEYEEAGHTQSKTGGQSSTLSKLGAKRTRCHQNIGKAIAPSPSHQCPQIIG